MRTILLGQTGSGKTTEILGSIRQRLAHNDFDFRLLTPTATMAEHLRNQLAREGLLVRPKTITTVARFVRELVPGQPAVGDAELRLLVASLIDAQRPPSLTDLLDSPGLPAAIARAIEDLANAGCDSLQWQALSGFHVYSSPVHRDLGPLYQAVEESLRARGLLLRSAQVLAAAQAVPSALPRLGLRAVYLDGFFSLTLAERLLVTALAAHLPVTVSLPEWPGVQPTLDGLTRAGFRIDRREQLRPHPRRTVVACPDSASVTNEIARRIRGLHHNGVPWREIGVIVRAAEPWAAPLETALARFGIPCRSYLATPLLGHPVCVLLSSAIAAAVSGYDHQLTLPALTSPVSLAGESAARDAFEYEVRKRLPDRGLASLRALARPLLALPNANAQPILDAIAILARFPSQDPALPSEWAAQIRSLEALIAAPDPQASADPQSLQAWRARAAALAGFRSALAEAAELLPAEPMDLARFWRLASPCLDGVSLRSPSIGRDAVALLDVQEARQWELPHVFLCGLIEGEFPRAPQSDSVLDEETRRRLIGRKIPVSSLEDRDHQESFLLEVALSRATRELVLLYPERDAKGEDTLPAFEVQRMPEAPVPPVPVVLQAGQPAPRPPFFQRIAAQRLLDHLATIHKLHRPTAIEKFLDCPYQFHARYTLRLRTPPPPVSQRLDLRIAGNIFHEAVAAWHNGAPDLMAAFEEAWNRTLAKERILPGFRTLGYELQLRRSLEAYRQDPSLTPGYQPHCEQDVELDLEKIAIRGRVDRYDIGPDGSCHVFDLKYIRESGLEKRVARQEEGRTVQGGLYTLALEAKGLRPISFTLMSVREELATHTYEGEALVQLETQARDLTLSAARRILDGEITPNPADSAICGYCDFIGTCRIAERPSMSAAGA